MLYGTFNFVHFSERQANEDGLDIYNIYASHWLTERTNWLVHESAMTDRRSNFNNKKKRKKEEKKPP